MVYVGALILAVAQQYSQAFLQFSQRFTNVKDNALPTIMLFIVLLLLPRAGLQFARVGSVKNVARVSTVRDTVLGMGVLFLVMAIIVQFLHGNNLTAFINGMCIAIVALSLVPLIGWAGQVSLAGLAFAGIGATAYARLGGAHGSPLAVLWAGLICIPIGALLAFPALRLQGLYLALATLAFASLVQFVFFSQPFAIGAGNRDVERLHIFGMRFDSDKSFFLLVVFVFGILAIGVVALRRSAFGRRLVAMRDSEAASATVGVNILETKLAVFALSAFIAGIAGAFLAMDYRIITPTGQNFEMLTGLPVVLALVIGGVACVSGALFAGLFSLGLVLIQSNWHLSLWADITALAPGLAVLSVISSPSGAVVEIGKGFAPFLPWRDDARREAAEEKAATAEAEVGELGLERPFTEADVLLVDRTLGISNDVPRVPVAGA
jgi:branched-chain amino acid transport system permease protein